MGIEELTIIKCMYCTKTINRCPLPCIYTMVYIVFTSYSQILDKTNLEILEITREELFASLKGVYHGSVYTGLFLIYTCPFYL